MGVLDDPDLINDSSILLSTDLLDSHVGGVGEIKPRVSVVRGPEGGPVWVILVEVVMFLSAARRSWRAEELKITVMRRSVSFVSNL